MDVRTSTHASANGVGTPAPWSRDVHRPSHILGAPDLAGIWDFRTSTPLQRPEEFSDRASLTDEEAAEFEEGAP